MIGEASGLKRNGFTVGIWLVSLISTSIAGLIATVFVMMAFGLDPSEIVTAGAEPWTNAVIAAAAFAGLALTTGLSLWLWHFTRFRTVPIIMTTIQAGCVAWACVMIYGDYL